MRLIYVSLFALLGAACGADDDSEPEPTARATWYQDVAPILAQHCMSCHQAGGIGPFELTNYDAAVENSERMMHEIGRGAMPPFDAREEADCTPRFSWVDDPRLNETEKTTLQHWIDDGHALGTEAAIPEPPDTSLPNISKTMTPVEGWATAGDRDQFICYLLDPGTTQLEWLTGLQVNPDNDLVVHHAVINQIPAGAMQQQLIDEHGIGKPWNCEATTPGDFVVHVWTPGNQPMQTSDDIAVPIAAGSKLVMQIHYHPAGLAHAPDKTSIDLRFSTKWPQKMYFVGALGNAPTAPILLPGPGDINGTPQFMIPKDTKLHTEHMRFTMGDTSALGDVRIYSANPHMHLVGTHISGTIDRGAPRGADPQKECLANGGWNFDWQRTYTYDTPLDKLPSVQTGDIVEVKCEWDNTIENPFVQRMLADAGLDRPINIELGEQTTNEMCLQIFGLAVNAPPPSSRDSFVLPKQPSFMPAPAM
ncbi:MAG TPA: cytochrome c [Kofleriaceae bacterium]